MDQTVSAIHFSPRAQQDVATAFKHYEQVHVGLGGRFLAELDAMLHLVARHPQSFQSIHNDIRRAVMHRFPYIIAYEIWQGSVIVLRVRASHQDPKTLLPSE